MTITKKEIVAAKGLYLIFDSLSSSAQEAFIKELIKKRKEEVEDYAFYLACKEARNDESMSEEELFQILKSE